MDTSSAAATGAPAAAENMKIMVAIDDSEDSFYSLQWVLDNFFGSGHQHMLTIIHVMEPFPHYFYPGAHAMFSTTSIIQSVNKAQEESASAILTHALSMCTRKQVKANSVIVEGDPKEMICELADQMQIDLIGIGSRALGKIQRAFLGSVSDYVIHHAECAVLGVVEFYLDDTSTINQSGCMRMLPGAAWACDVRGLHWNSIGVGPKKNLGFHYLEHIFNFFK